MLAVKPCFVQNRLVSISIDDLIATFADSSAHEYTNDQIIKTLEENNSNPFGFVNENRLYTNNKPDSAKNKIFQK